MRILLVDADRTLHNWTRFKLESEGMIVESAFDSLDATDFLLSLPFDAVVLSGPLPDTKVSYYIRDLRRDKIVAPIIVTGPSSAIDAVLCLDAGADDYLRQPFHSDELVARIRSLVRRAAGRASSVVTTGALTLDLTAQTVEVLGKGVHISFREYQLLELLSLRKGVTLTKEMMMAAMYGGMDEPEIKIIDVFICKLRKKLRDAGADGLIETVWGRGYIFREQAPSEVNLAPELHDMVANGYAGGINRDKAYAESIYLEQSPSLVPSL